MAYVFPMSAGRWAQSVGALGFAAILLLTSHAEGSVPPPVRLCETDDDCEGCSSCLEDAFGGTSCVGVTEECWCHDECARAGFQSCVLLRADRPLCGGTCSAAPPTSSLPCGQGDDMYVAEPLCRVTDTDASSAGFGAGVELWPTPRLNAPPAAPVVWPTMGTRGILVLYWVLSSVALAAAAHAGRRRRLRRAATLTMAAMTFAACGSDDESVDASAHRPDAAGGEAGNAGTESGEDAARDASFDRAGDNVVPTSDAADVALPEADVVLSDASDARDANEAGVCNDGVEPSNETITAIDGPTPGLACPTLDCASWTVQGPWLEVRPNSQSGPISPWVGSALSATAEGWLWVWTSSARMHLLRISDDGAPLAAPRAVVADNILGIVPLSASVVLWASRSPYYAPDGYKQPMWELSPDLETVQQGWMLRSPNATTSAFAFGATADESRQLLAMARHRKDLLVSSVAVARDGILEQRQHWLGSSTSFVEVQWLGTSLGVVHLIGGELVYSRLDPDSGEILARTTLASGFLTGTVKMQALGDKVWILIADYARGATSLRAFDWNGVAVTPSFGLGAGTLSGFAASADKIALFGSLSGTPSRPRLVVLDTATGAYRDHAMVVPPGTTNGEYAAIAAVAFGPCGLGTLLQVWAAGAPRFYFTRLGCSV